MKTVYLAGPIAGLSYDGATEWREEAERRLDGFQIKALSPMRAKPYLKDFDRMPDEINTPLSSRKGIVTRDRNDVMTCDGMILYVLGASTISIGSMIEIGWADAFRKPIVTVMNDSDIHYHAMVREMSGFIVTDLGAAIIVMATVLNKYS